MRLAIGSDHRGLELKNDVIHYLTQVGHTYQDFGTQDEVPVDYPDIARKVAEAVSRGEYERGILICGTGIGMSITANKFKGIRAALCCDAFMAQRARQHNDANILCLGADRPAKLKDIVHVFISTEFEAGRHLRRVDKVKGIEDDCQSRFA
jgi:ribose 5-phosphate isomerase B